ncbi:MAG: transporter [Kiritimatiellales bacterium]|nr:transporter [Kiritimatiellota bacterium]MBL7012522.1 transporter [Kiritimatiellales bacterium]
MRNLLARSIATVLCLFAFLAAPALAYDQPSVNLGLTSFLDGGPPAGPGLYFQEYLQYYTASHVKDAPFPATDPEINVWVSLNQLVYQSDQDLFFGGKWGMNMILPVVQIDSDIPAAPDNGTGFGDLVVGPFLQWDPIMGDNGPIFMHRIELAFILPTGKYAPNRALNPGSNFVSFNPYWAATYFFSPKLTASTRVHYLWNAKNTDPNTPGALHDTQAGQAFHANFAVNYEVIPKKLRLGLNGYALKQITASKVDGNKVAGKEQVFAIGPGALFSFSQDTHLFFNAYFESGAEYRPEGERYVLRLVHHF